MEKEPPLFVQNTSINLGYIEISMRLIDLQNAFNRATHFTLSFKKIVLVSIILALCGLCVIFFRSLAMHTSHWVTLSLTFIPIFLCAGVLLSAGILLTRIYHDEIKGKEFTYGEVLSKSWEVIIGASYFSIPVILIYLLLWMTLGIFILLKEIPGIGSFFSAILAFAPFLINLASILLCIFAILVLYYITPAVAFKGVNRIQIAESLTKRFKSDAFVNIILGFVAIVPLIFSMVILLIAAFLTESICDNCTESVYLTVHSFFMMIPFVILLSPAVIFFFNFAAEAHVLMKKIEPRALTN